MANKITSKPARLVVSTSNRYRSIDTEQVANVIGAEKTNEGDCELSGNPRALLVLRRELYKRLWPGRRR